MIVYLTWRKTIVGAIRTIVGGVVINLVAGILTDLKLNKALQKIFLQRMKMIGKNWSAVKMMMLSCRAFNIFQVYQYFTVYRWYF